MISTFFSDPVLRAPILGSMLMCFSAALIGCLVYLQRRSLVGEALSHAAYPGIVIGVMIASLLLPFSDGAAATSILIGALLSASLGLILVQWLEEKVRMSSDAALCFVLAFFFGLGVLLASHLQVSHALWLRQVQVFLFGQAATMVDAHIVIYGILALVVLVTVVFLYRYLQILNFDLGYAQVIGMPIHLIRGLSQFLLVLSIVIGMRSVGVVLMSAMFIAPPIAARPLSRTLPVFLAISALIGMTSGLCGVAFSLLIPNWVGLPQISLPTGPMIVLTASFFSILSLLFAPQTGVIVKWIRAARFRFRCKRENALKAIYKGRDVSLGNLLLFHLRLKGWLVEGRLTGAGYKEAEKLIRFHRLWEAYLVYMRQHASRVHYSAEEMEHILTPELEKQLSHLLNDPEFDPHRQPIPRGESREEEGR